MSGATSMRALAWIAALGLLLVARSVPGQETGGVQLAQAALMPPVSPVSPVERDKASQPAIPSPQENGYFLADPPLGFAGKSRVPPPEDPADGHFLPDNDRWRLGYPEWDRYGEGHPLTHEYPYQPGHWWDPYNLNVLKGDYPIYGQHTFLNLTGTSRTVLDYFQIPTPPPGAPATGIGDRPNQFFPRQFFSLSAELSHGDIAFAPLDWRIRVTPVFGLNYLTVQEPGVVNANPAAGTTRGRSWFSLEEWFVEKKLADLSPHYDFVSVRAGVQQFNADFRGFVFNDTNRGVRLFGNADNNVYQYNLAYFRQQDKDVNSFLNEFDDRGQDVVIANLYRQDFLWLGYNASLNLLFNHDDSSPRFDQNDFQTRPDAIPGAQQHTVDAVYLGWGGSGHIGRLNVMNQFYWVVGQDSYNALAARPVALNAQLAVLELSFDFDWARLRSSILWASGDRNVHDSQGTGFDAIFDSPNFAGGEFSYWEREQIRRAGVDLVNRDSFFPDLRSNKLQGVSNFVNPGLRLLNFGLDADLTPRLRMFNNVNLLAFDRTEPLTALTGVASIRRFIGTDLSTGLEYRPLLNNQIILTFGVSTLIPGSGLEDVFRPVTGDVDPMAACFLDVNLSF